MGFAETAGVLERLGPSAAAAALSAHLTQDIDNTPAKQTGSTKTAEPVFFCGDDNYGRKLE